MTLIYFASPKQMSEQKMNVWETFMGVGIVVCGLNGAGKSTLGKAVAKRLGFAFIDSEELHFVQRGGHTIYTFSRSDEEVEKRLLQEMEKHKNFILASVKGDYGEAALPFFQYVVLLHAPKDIRLQRVRNRSFQKFGKRMLPGGDLHEQESSFLKFVASRAEDTVEKWAYSLACPVIRVDGTNPVTENTAFIIAQLRNNGAFL